MSWQRLCRLLRLRRLGANTHLCTPALAIRYVASLMPQPAAPRGRPGLPPVFLLASTNEKKLFAEYEKSAEVGTISFETFRQQWQIHAPEVAII